MRILFFQKIFNKLQEELIALSQIVLLLVTKAVFKTALQIVKKVAEMIQVLQVADVCRKQNTARRVFGWRLLL